MAGRRPIDDDHFRQFAHNLEGAISKYDADETVDLTVRQKEQVERLVGLEKEFRRTLIAHPWGPGVYKAFIRHICDEKRNILAARPYFRERQPVFTNQISKALKKRAEKSLYRFHFNFEFVLFALDVYKWNRGSKIVKLAKRIHETRNELIEMNMPLAISRARIFWSRTPAAQLSYMDLVQITALGLMSGIDKFVLPYTTAFRAVLIGRMLGNLIEQYSETLVHFFPLDKRKIYRANKTLSRFGENPDYQKVADEVNRDVDEAHKTTPAEIADLVAASSTVSSDAPTQNNENAKDDGGDSLPLDSFHADESTHPDVRVETMEALTVMSKAIQDLPLVERKLLKMRGVSL